MRAIGLVVLLAGCELYFGNNNNQGPVPLPDATVRLPDASPPPPPPPDAAPVTGADCDIFRECLYGQYCGWDHHCTATAQCSTTAQAKAAGYLWCDTMFYTARPQLPAQGTCQTSLANVGTAPTCPSGQIPTVGQSATDPTKFPWTGQCVPLLSCDVPPDCVYINDRDDCTMMRCSVHGDPYPDNFQGCGPD
jgi:hypothetical protein